MSYVEDAHRALGVLDQVPIGPPGLVQTLPDDYVPSFKEHPTFAWSLAAGGAGTRSEIVLRVDERIPDRVVFEITELWLAVTTVSTTMEIMVLTAAALSTLVANAVTDLPNMGRDLGQRNTRLRFTTRNTAAASATERTVMDSIIGSSVSNQYIRIPAGYIIRGGPGNDHICIRPETDNVGIRIMGQARILEKRTL